MNIRKSCSRGGYIFFSISLMERFRQSCILESVYRICRVSPSLSCCVSQLIIYPPLQNMAHLNHYNYWPHSHGCIIFKCYNDIEGGVTIGGHSFHNVHSVLNLNLNSQPHFRGLSWSAVIVLWYITPSQTWTAVFTDAGKCLCVYIHLLFFSLYITSLPWNPGGSWETTVL